MIQPLPTTSAGASFSSGCAAKYRSLACIKLSDSPGNRDWTTIVAKRNIGFALVIGRRHDRARHGRTPSEKRGFHFTGGHGLGRMRDGLHSSISLSKNLLH
jgi:hypothetical protein